MKRATFCKMTLVIAVVGALIALGMLASWKLGGVRISDGAWLRFYPASLMLMLIAGTSGVATVLGRLMAELVVSQLKKSPFEHFQHPI